MLCVINKITQTLDFFLFPYLLTNLNWLYTFQYKYNRHITLLLSCGLAFTLDVAIIQLSEVEDELFCVLSRES